MSERRIRTEETGAGSIRPHAGTGTFQKMEWFASIKMATQTIFKYHHHITDLYRMEWSLQKSLRTFFSFSILVLNFYWMPNYRYTWLFFFFFSLAHLAFSGDIGQCNLVMTDGAMKNIFISFYFFLFQPLLWLWSYKQNGIHSRTAYTVPFLLFFSSIRLFVCMNVCFTAIKSNHNLGF